MAEIVSEIQARARAKAEAIVSSEALKILAKIGLHTGKRHFSAEEVIAMNLNGESIGYSPKRGKLVLSPVIENKDVRIVMPFDSFEDFRRIAIGNYAFVNEVEVACLRREGRFSQFGIGPIEFKGIFSDRYFLGAYFSRGEAEKKLKESNYCNCHLWMIGQKTGDNNLLMYDAGYCLRRR